MIREYNAMHEENFLSSWLREGLVGKEEGSKKEDKKIREEVKKKGKREEEENREGEKEEIEVVRVRSRCIESISAEAFDISCQGRRLGELWFFLVSLHGGSW